MTLLGRYKEVTVRALLDPGATVPVLSDKVVEALHIPTIRRKEPRLLSSWNSEVSKDAGALHTPELILRHQSDHFSRISFEISPLDDECDMIIPHWWLQQHRPSSFWDQDSNKIDFKSAFCRENCTSLAVLGKAEHVSAVKMSEFEHLSRIPLRFREFTPLATSQAAERLPDHQPWDHSIDIIGDEPLPWGPLYAMSGKEKKILRKWLDKMLAEGKIRPSTSPCSCPIFFVNKEASLEKRATRDPDDLRPVVDFRPVNKRSSKNRYPLPLITELQDALAGSTIFTKIDLKSGFNLIRMKEGEEWKTAFRSCFGLFEFTVMSFGLANAPATFQAMINHIFKDLIDKELLAYIDDLLIHARNREEHDKVLYEVLKRLRDNHLAINPAKCEWEVEVIDYLGYTISATGIEMSKAKVECILSWETPACLKGVQSFLGFANFYKPFVTHLVSP